MNPAWERILGYTREELMAKRFLEFVHPDDLDRTREAVSTLASQQKVFSFENRYRCKDGTYRWLEWSSAPAGKLIYAAARDVTERKQAEEALEDRLRFERLLSDLSARFVNIPPDRVDSEIEDGLRQLLEFFQVDHCTLLRILPGKASFQITHDASSDDVPPVPVGVDLPRSLYPWAYEKLAEKHEVVSISRLDDLPAEANVDRQTCIEWGIRSYVNIPILIGESVDHIIHVSSVKSERVWPEELFPRLRLLGEIFVNALERKQAEEASRESERILRQNESDLRGLAGRLIYAQEEERSRLARELHDDLAQRLAVFAIDVGRLEQQLMDPPAPVQEELREMKNSIVKISQDVHSLSRQLHPSILDDLGLIKAVESECTSFSRREGIEIVFNHENIPRVIPKDISLSLYRIIQEGLRNISKHACAEHISVSLKGIDHDVLLSVQDDGIGFDSAEVKEKPGLGFSSMRERARLIHGELSITIPAGKRNGDHRQGAFNEGGRMKKPRVLLADDHKIVLEGLKSLLGGEFEVVGSVEDGRALVDQAATLHPDVIVADISMPQLNGIEAARQIKKTDKNIKIVFLTMHPDATYAANAFEAGASGFVLKHSAPSELITAIHEAMKGRTYVTPLIAGDLIRTYQEGGSPEKDLFKKISPRQREILQLLAEGKSGKEIASILNISARTVEFHKYRMMEQLNIKTSAELVQYAVKHGIISV